MLGLAQSELVGMPLGRFFLPAEGLAFEALLRSAYLNQGAQVAELVLRQSGAQPRFVQMEIVQEGEAQTCQVSVVDITDRNLLLSTAVMSMFLIWRHSENISRLVKGTESKLGRKKEGGK